MISYATKSKDKVQTNRNGTDPWIFQAIIDLQVLIIECGFQKQSNALVLSDIGQKEILFPSKISHTPLNLNIIWFSGPLNPITYLTL